MCFITNGDLVQNQKIIYKKIKEIETMQVKIISVLHEHDKKLVAKVCEKIKKYLFEKCEFDYGYYINDGDFTVPDLLYFLDQIQKEFEDEQD